MPGYRVSRLPLRAVTKQFLLLDANIKKTRFIQQAIIELNLENIQVSHQRVEQFTPQTMIQHGH